MFLCSQIMSVLSYVHKPRMFLVMFQNVMCSRLCSEISNVLMFTDPVCSQLCSQQISYVLMFTNHVCFQICSQILYVLMFTNHVCYHFMFTNLECSYFTNLVCSQLCSHISLVMFINLLYSWLCPTLFAYKPHPDQLKGDLFSVLKLCSASSQLSSAQWEYMFISCVSYSMISRRTLSSCYKTSLSSLRPLKTMIIHQGPSKKTVRIRCSLHKVSQQTQIFTQF